MLGELIKNKVVRNAGWLVFGRMAQMLINLVVGLLTARYLGPSNYGLINYATAYVSFFAALCNLGINSVLVKELIDHPDGEGQVIGTSLGLKFVSSFLSAVTIIGIVCIMDRDEPVTMAVVALSTIGMVFHLFDTFQYWFQSKLKSKVTALCTLIAYIVTAAYRVVLLVLEADVSMFALATSVDYLCVAILMGVCYRKYGGAKLGFSWAYAKSLLSRSGHFILPSIMVSVYAQTDKLMLKQMISDAEIGYYSTAASLATVWCFVLTAIIDSLYPSIAQAFKTDEHQFNKLNKRLYAMVFYLSVFVSLCFVLLAEPVITVLYGAAYLPAVVPLRVITWYTAFSYLGVARNAWIVCKNRQKYLVYVYASAALANILLNLLLIPVLGSTGAALASLISQIITTMVAPFFIKGLRENSVMMLEAICFKGL